MEMPESFFRMLHYGDFEASEMSFSWYTRSYFSDPRPFIAIPVFPSRMFRHSCIYVNVDSKIDGPEDLPGKRVGVPEYQMSDPRNPRGPPWRPGQQRHVLHGRAGATRTPGSRDESAC